MSDSRETRENDLVRLRTPGAASDRARRLRRCAPLEIDGPSGSAADMPKRGRIPLTLGRPEAAVGNRFGRHHTSGLDLADQRTFALGKVANRDALPVPVHDLAFARKLERPRARAIWGGGARYRTDDAGVNDGRADQPRQPARCLDDLRSLATPGQPDAVRTRS